jgi:putative hydrolase of the HAD superfamily
VTGLRAILFDFGGTLDGAGQSWGDRFAAAYDAHDLAVPRERLREATGHGTRQAYREPAVRGFGLEATVAFHVACQFSYLGIEDRAAADAVVRTFLAVSMAALQESRAVLARLGHRFRLGVVSNFYGNLDRILHSSGIAPLLGVTCDSTLEGVSKPDPRIFMLAVERLGLRSEDVLFVGDSYEQDIVPARAAGMRTAWLLARQPARDDSVADLRLDTLAELERLR